MQALVTVVGFAEFLLVMSSIEFQDGAIDQSASDRRFVGGIRHEHIVAAEQNDCCLEIKIPNFYTSTLDLQNFSVKFGTLKCN